MADQSARLFLCACCRIQVLVCRQCDRGQRYCADGCAATTRQALQRDSARRYQRGRAGRFKHALRTRRWRARQVALVNIVTHQGSHDPPSDDVLPATQTSALTAKLAADFVNASRGLDDAVSKLQAVVAGITPNLGSQVLNDLNGALAALTPAAKNVEALLSGEPATALPGMVETNLSTFPTPSQPIVPPVRELARADTDTGAAVAGGNDVDQMIADILKREGGFTNHPSDRGGPTNFGITQRSLEVWRGHGVTIDDVRNMTVDEARKTYRAEYCARPKIDQLPKSVQPVMFDMSINHGPATAIKLLQQVLNETGNTCAVDGGIGDETLASAKAAASALGDALKNKLVDRRVAFYQAIVARDASQNVFLRGWLNRANEFRVA